MLDIREAYAAGSVVECNVIPNGFSLFRLDMLRQVSSPRFLTLDGSKGYNATQDVYFCKKAKAETGARFAAHCGAKVGHYDSKTGDIF